MERYREILVGDESYYAGNYLDILNYCDAAVPRLKGESHD